MLEIKCDEYLKKILEKTSDFAHENGQKETAEGFLYVVIQEIAQKQERTLEDVFCIASLSNNGIDVSTARDKLIETLNVSSDTIEKKHVYWNSILQKVAIKYPNKDVSVNDVIREIFEETSDTIKAISSKKIEKKDVVSNEQSVKMNKMLNEIKRLVDLIKE